MTHTNHRLGDRKSLEGDYVLFTKIENSLIPEQKDKLKPGFKRALEICEKYDPVLISTELKEPRERGDVDLHRRPDQVLPPDGVRFRAKWIKGWKGEEFHSIVKSRADILTIENPQKYCSVVYDNKESLLKALTDLKEADLGHSVVVSGIFEDVFEACGKIGTGPHTVNMSAGIGGKTALLPERKTLEITTMCGHGYVSRYLVEHLINLVKKRKMTIEDAAVELSKQCICNFFNPVRAANLIEKYIASEE
jgi:hypothetical protein